MNRERDDVVVWMVLAAACWLTTQTVAPAPGPAHTRPPIIDLAPDLTLRAWPPGSSAVSVEVHDETTGAHHQLRLIEGTFAFRTDCPDVHIGDRVCAVMLDSPPGMSRETSCVGRRTPPVGYLWLFGSLALLLVSLLRGQLARAKFSADLPAAPADQVRELAGVRRVVILAAMLLALIAAVAIPPIGVALPALGFEALRANRVRSVLGRGGGAAVVDPRGRVFVTRDGKLVAWMKFPPTTFAPSLPEARIRG